jgi:ATPase subunit of ABC transporter with duplicated ATPase domains
VTKSFGDREILKDLSTLIYKNDRIILTGPNGTGKTTLLRCIAELLPLDAGEIKRASSAKIAYLDQEVDLLPKCKTPLQYFESRFSLTEEGLRRELAKAALGGEGLISRPFSTLSAGQRKRLMLLHLILEKPNILLLDEPTNHLDFLTLEALERALLDFEGVIIVATHDATLIEKLMHLCRERVRRIYLSLLKERAF